MRGRTGKGGSTGGPLATYRAYAAPMPWRLRISPQARPGSPSLILPANPCPSRLPPNTSPPPFSGQQLVDMKAGDIYIIQYRLVQRLVQQDIAVLI